LLSPVSSTFVKWGRKSEPAAEPDVDETEDESLGKGRPTPKRRDVVPKRGPVTAPKTRKEAYARQKQQAKSTRSAARTPVRDLTPAQRRELMRKGDPSVLPRRDQGQTKKLARDYVDSHRMASNYLLILFLIVLVATFAGVPILELLVLAIFIGLLVEWYFVGRKVRRLAIERFGSAQGTNFSIGYYCGTRAYIPRRWRLPAPQHDRGDTI
jgi:hypothetical protein